MLFGGWLLVMPPGVTDGVVRDHPRIDTPVAEWVPESLHDSAVACERARLSGIQSSRDHQQSTEGVERPWRVALCVPAESVGSPKK
jgi:hypothetical protein